jgi:CRP/FNR family transcriptional regulator, cyclic AMP receptor protein
MAAGTSSFNVRAFLTTLGKGSTVGQYVRNQMVFQQGEACDAVYFVQEGALKLTITSERGRRATVAVLGAGDFIGETCLHGPEKHRATARALTDSTVVKVNRHSMMRAIRDNGEFSDFFIRYLLTRHSRMQEDLVDQLFNSSEKRLARTLLLLAGCGDNGEIEGVVHNISQETLAEMVGTTRSRVNVFMNKFRKLGLISYNHGVHVHASLQAFVQGRVESSPRSTA